MVGAQDSNLRPPAPKTGASPIKSRAIPTVGVAFTAWRINQLAPLSECPRRARGAAEARWATRHTHAAAGDRRQVRPPPRTYLEWPAARGPPARQRRTGSQLRLGERIAPLGGRPRICRYEGETH